MEHQKETERINHFLCFVTPIVIKFVKGLLESADLQVLQEGSGTEATLSIRKGEKQAKMYLQNLLLEIATVDRDQQPLRFDQRLEDFEFFMTKTARLTESKLKILFHVFAEEDVDVAIENISLDAKQYERIRIWQFDQKDTGSEGRWCL